MKTVGPPTTWVLIDLFPSTRAHQTRATSVRDEEGVFHRWLNPLRPRSHAARAVLLGAKEPETAWNREAFNEFNVTKPWCLLLDPSWGELQEEGVFRRCKWVHTHLPVPPLSMTQSSIKTHRL